MIAQLALTQAEELVRLEEQLHDLAAQALATTERAPRTPATPYCDLPDAVRDAVRAALAAGCFPDLPGSARPCALADRHRPAPRGAAARRRRVDGQDGGGSDQEDETDDVPLAKRRRAFQPQQPHSGAAPCGASATAAPHPPRPTEPSAIRSSQAPGLGLPLDAPPDPNSSAVAGSSRPVLLPASALPGTNSTRTDAASVAALLAAEQRFREARMQGSGAATMAQGGGLPAPGPGGQQGQQHEQQPGTEHAQQPDPQQGKGDSVQEAPVPPKRSPLWLHQMLPSRGRPRVAGLGEQPASLMHFQLAAVQHCKPAQTRGAGRAVGQALDPHEPKQQDKPKRRQQQGQRQQEQQQQQPVAGARDSEQGQPVAAVGPKNAVAVTDEGRAARPAAAANGACPGAASGTPDEAFVQRATAAPRPTVASAPSASAAAAGAYAEVQPRSRRGVGGADEGCVFDVPLAVRLAQRLQQQAAGAGAGAAATAAAEVAADAACSLHPAADAAPQASCPKASTVGPMARADSCDCATVMAAEKAPATSRCLSEPDHCSWDADPAGMADARAGPGAATAQATASRAASAARAEAAAEAAAAPAPDPAREAASAAQDNWTVGSKPERRFAPTVPARRPQQPRAAAATAAAAAAAGSHPSMCDDLAAAAAWMAAHLAAEEGADGSGGSGNLGDCGASAAGGNAAAPVTTGGYSADGGDCGGAGDGGPVPAAGPALAAAAQVQPGDGPPLAPATGAACSGRAAASSVMPASKEDALHEQREPVGGAGSGAGARAYVASMPAASGPSVSPPPAQRDSSNPAGAGCGLHPPMACAARPGGPDSAEAQQRPPVPVQPEAAAASGWAADARGACGGELASSCGAPARPGDSRAGIDGRSSGDEGGGIGGTDGGGSGGNSSGGDCEAGGRGSGCAFEPAGARGVTVSSSSGSGSDDDGDAEGDAGGAGSAFADAGRAGSPEGGADDGNEGADGMPEVEREEWRRRRAEIERQRAQAAAEREAVRRARSMQEQQGGAAAASAAGAPGAAAEAELQRRIRERLQSHHQLALAAATEATAKEQLRSTVREQLHKEYCKALSERSLTKMLRQLGVLPKGPPLRTAEQRGRALKAAKIRFHPDKAPGGLEAQVYAEEVSKLLNSWEWL